MTLPSWTTTDEWHTLYLGGELIPGVSKVNVKLGSGLDIQKPKGGKKATIRDEGAPPAEFAVETQLVDLAEAQAFQEIVPLLRPPSKGGARDPLEVTHPLAQLWDVDVVTVGPIDSPSPGPGGALIVKYTLHEWRDKPVEVKKSKKKPRNTDDANGESGTDINDLIASAKPSATAAP